MRGRRRLIVELVLLFLVLPTLLLFSLPRALAAALIGTAFAYVLLVTWRRGWLRGRPAAARKAADYRPILLRFAAFCVATTVTVTLLDRAALFAVVVNNPLLWLAISAVYCVLSVVPQNLVFRVFFFERYQHLFASRGAALVVNAALFAWAHVIIAHPLVFALTFCGGLLFAFSYLKHRSLVLVSLEHALYGLWLFTVGLGPYFAFP